MRFSGRLQGPTRSSSLAPRLGALALVGTLAALSVGDAPAGGETDPLLADLEHWSQVARDTSSADEMMKSLCQQMVAPLDLAMAEWRAGRRWAALHRFAPLRINLAAGQYVEALGARQDDEPLFATEYARIGAELRADSAAATVASFTALSPMVVRAEAEATFPQAMMFRDASLEYGRNTMMRYGFFYLGGALAQRDFAALCRKLASPSDRPAPSFRPIRPALDALQGQLVAAYRPPLSVSRHSEFIAASSVLKEARALDAAGLHAGALLRYLQAVTRAAPLLGSGHEPAPDSLQRVLDAWAARLAGERLDHSLGALLIELARGDLAGAPGSSPANSIAIALETLPRYFDAIGSGSGGGAIAGAAAAASNATPITVTLVRWPFT